MQAIVENILNRAQMKHRFLYLEFEFYTNRLFQIKIRDGDDRNSENICLSLELLTDVTRYFRRIR